MSAARNRLTLPPLSTTIHAAKAILIPLMVAVSMTKAIKAGATAEADTREVVMVDMDSAASLVGCLTDISSLRSHAVVSASAWITPG